MINHGGVMKRSVTVVVMAMVLSACAGPKFSGRAIEPRPDPDQYDVVVVEDRDTKDGFRIAIEEWLETGNYHHSVAPDRSRHDPERLTVEYYGEWKWDLAIYLSRANISAFHDGQRVGSVDFHAPNSLNGNKFGDGAERVKYMMDVLFGRISASEATAEVN